MVGRPYHSDPGLNHGIPEEFQILGYPILSIRSIPKDREYLDRYYKAELDKGTIKTPLELNHVWPENYSANSAQKVWAVGFAAHHPNVVLLDLSSFKCGHDAPTYGLVESIVSAAKTPYAALHDIDANKPSGSIKIRVRTYVHALKLHEERLSDHSQRKRTLAVAIDRKRLELLEIRSTQLAARRMSDPQIIAQIEALREKLAAYEAPPAQPEEAPKGLMQLGKKNQDGSISRVATAPQNDTVQIAQEAE